MQVFIPQQFNRSIDDAGYSTPFGVNDADLNPILAPDGGCYTVSRQGVADGYRLVRVITHDAAFDEGGGYDLCEVEPTQ